MSAAVTFVVGDVVRYTPKDQERHCREWQARAEIRRDRVILVDTFWGSYQDAHVLTDDELTTAEWQFNLSDYRRVDRGERWIDFHPSNRVVVTHQHGLQRDEYVRTGSEPDMTTRIENAKEKVEEAQRELDSATRWLEWRKEDLANLLEEPA